MREVGLLARTLWGFVTTVVGVAIVTPVREGTLRLRDHPPAIAGITWVISAVIGVLLVGMVAANQLRASTDLIASVDDSGNSIVPAFLVPATLFLLAIAIALVLAGTQRLRLWLRILLLIAATAILGDLIHSSVIVTRDLLGPWAVRLPWVILAVLVGYCLLIWTGRTRASVDFFVLLVLATVIAVVSYRGFIAGNQMVDWRFDLLTTTTLLLPLTALAMPIGFTSGLAATKFGTSILEQAGGFVARRATVFVASLILLVVIGQQAIVVTPGVLERWSALGRLGAFGATLGGLLTVGLCVLVWRVVHRFSGRSETPEKDASDIATAVALPVAYALTAPLIASNLLALIGTVAISGSPEAHARLVTFVGALGGETAVATARGATIAGLVTAGVWMISRHRPRAASILFIDAIMLAVVLFAAPFMQAARLGWTVADLGNIGLVIGSALFTWWAARRKLSPDRLALLFTVVMLSGLVRQADFFEVPFEFLIGSSTIAVLIVGLIWGFLVDGGEAHEDSPRSPRDGKLLFFLGRVLFGITIAAWAVIGKQIDSAEQLSRTAELAVLTVGTGYIVVRVLELTAGQSGPDHAQDLTAT